MLKFADRFERIISMILLGFGLVIIAYQVVQLIWNTVKSFEQRFSEIAKYRKNGDGCSKEGANCRIDSEIEVPESERACCARSIGGFLNHPHLRTIFRRPHSVGGGGGNPFLSIGGEFARCANAP